MIERCPSCGVGPVATNLQEIADCAVRVVRRAESPADLAAAVREFHPDFTDGPEEKVGRRRSNSDARREKNATEQLAADRGHSADNRGAGTMSTEYHHWLTPENMRAVPSGAQLDAIVRALVSTGWVDSTQLAYRVQGYGSRLTRNFLRVGHVADDLAIVSRDVDGVLIQLPAAEAERAAGDNRIYSDMPAGTPLGPHQCQGIDLLLSRRVCMLPWSEETGAELPCSSCGDDLLPQLLKLPATHWSFIALEIEGRLGSCSSCGKPLSLEQLKGRRRASDGAMADEPTFRFAVCLTADAPPDPDRAESDPGLLAILNEHTGQSFRAFPRWA